MTLAGIRTMPTVWDMLLYCMPDTMDNRIASCGIEPSNENETFRSVLRM